MRRANGAREDAKRKERVPSSGLPEPALGMHPESWGCGGRQLARHSSKPASQPAVRLMWCGDGARKHRPSGCAQHAGRSMSNARVSRWASANQDRGCDAAAVVAGRMGCVEAGRMGRLADVRAAAENNAATQPCSSADGQTPYSSRVLLRSRARRSMLLPTTANSRHCCSLACVA